MKDSRQQICKRVILFLAIMGFFGVAHADERTSPSRSNRREVFERLKSVQSNLDLLLAGHQLTPDQYQTESEKVRQLRLQTHVDAQEHADMTQDDRDTDFQLIQQLSQEITQLTVTNGSGPLANQNLPQGASISDLNVQYSNLNNQYRDLDARYVVAIAAKDLQTAQTIRTQLQPLSQQLEDMRLRMEDQIRSTSTP